MPPRYAFWTILIDGKATAFRAREKDELLPTFQQLKRTNKDVVFKWFARGRLWETPEESQAAVRAPKVEREKRSSAWRPGGAHADPRERFKKKSGARSHDTRPKPSDVAPVFRPASPRPPHKYGSRPSGPREPRPWRDKPSGPPRGDRPWSKKPPSGASARGDRPWRDRKSDRPPRPDRPPDRREHQPPPPKPRPEPVPGPPPPESIKIEPDPPERG